MGTANLEGLTLSCLETIAASLHDLRDLSLGLNASSTSSLKHSQRRFRSLKSFNLTAGLWNYKVQGFSADEAAMWISSFLETDLTLSLTNWLACDSEHPFEVSPGFGPAFDRWVGPYEVFMDEFRRVLALAVELRLNDRLHRTDKFYIVEL